MGGFPSYDHGVGTSGCSHEPIREIAAAGETVRPNAATMGAAEPRPAFAEKPPLLAALRWIGRLPRTPRAIGLIVIAGLLGTVMMVLVRLLGAEVHPFEINFFRTVFRAPLKILLFRASSI